MDKIDLEEIDVDLSDIPAVMAAMEDGLLPAPGVQLAILKSLLHIETMLEQLTKEPASDDGT